MIIVPFKYFLAILVLKVLVVLYKQLILGKKFKYLLTRKFLFYKIKMAAVGSERVCAE